MTRLLVKRVVVVGMIANLCGPMIGCLRPSGEETRHHATQTPQPALSAPGEDQQTASHRDHSGWWCVEHGVPEKDCTVCSAEAAARFREKGDWCEEHNRAESQCFLCDPARAEKFIKLYQAKFGQKPPARTE